MLQNSHKQLLSQAGIVLHQFLHSRLLCNLIAALQQLVHQQQTQMHTLVNTFTDTSFYLFLDSKRNFMQTSISSVSVTASATTAYSRTVFLLNP